MSAPWKHCSCRLKGSRDAPSWAVKQIEDLAIAEGVGLAHTVTGGSAGRNSEQMIHSLQQLGMEPTVCHFVEVRVQRTVFMAQAKHQRCIKCITCISEFAENCTQVIAAE
jgi:hypothetical protein